MKTRIIIFIISFTIAMLGLSAGSIAQPNPFGNANGSGTGGPPIGGGTAPIGSGITLILLMAAGYGVKRYFDARYKFEVPATKIQIRNK